VRPVKLPVRAVSRGASLPQALSELQKTYRVSPERVSLAGDCARAALSALRSLRPGDVVLYAGIPFCPSRCAYCSFISASGRANALIPAYLDALTREMAEKGRLARERGLRIRGLYLGGGTPTVLSAEQLRRLLAALEEHFDLPGGLEYTAEAGRPDTITREKLEVLRAYGVNRVSVNPQTMCDKILRAVGRNHTAEDSRRALALVQEVGFPVVNTDLIAGLPGDSPDGFSRGLAEVLSFAPENVTVHTLARKNGARLSRNGATEEPPLPQARETARMVDGARDTLRGAGYLPYYLYRQKFTRGGENVGYCKPGTENLYNLCMMEELCGVLALGAGGVTKRVEYSAGKLRRAVNPKYPQEYITQRTADI
jgi:oxygen-independent coproporphyrinogen-3 oxidase